MWLPGTNLVTEKWLPRWILMDSDVPGWVQMGHVVNADTSQWIPKGPVGLHWVPMGPNGSRWIQMDPDGSIWIQMDPDGSDESLWIPMDLYGSYES